jgi:hypothetical protein
MPFSVVDSAGTISLLRASLQEKTLRSPAVYVIYGHSAAPTRRFQVSAKNRVAVIALFMLLFSASHASAELYRWVDKDGQEFFTNELTKVPQEYQSKATSVKTDDSRVSVGGTPARPHSPTVVVKEHRDKNGRGEEWWRRRAGNQRLELRKLEDDLDLLLKKEQDQEKKSTRTSGKKKKSSAANDRKKMQLEKKVALAKRRLEVDLPEEARKADAYPGWLRE